MSRRAVIVDVVAVLIVACLLTFAAVLINANLKTGPGYNPPTPSTYPVPTTNPDATTRLTFV